MISIKNHKTGNAISTTGAVLKNKYTNSHVLKIIFCNETSQMFRNVAQVLSKESFVQMLCQVLSKCFINMLKVQ